ncbi:MAG: hypothetical protein R3250_18295 [Melioribacteraceae bacterium]|nr:hypothetical protein [Melioribacteraceae bacterium]
MKKKLTLLLLFLMLSSCSLHKLSLSEVKFFPEKVSKGEKILLMVKVEDSENMITSIMAVVRRDEGYKFELNDDGEDHWQIECL